MHRKNFDDVYLFREVFYGFNVMMEMAMANVRAYARTYKTKRNSAIKKGMRKFKRGGGIIRTRVNVYNHFMDVSIVGRQAKCIDGLFFSVTYLIF